MSMTRLKLCSLAMAIVSMVSITSASQAYQLSPKGSAREIRLERLNVSYFANGQILLYRYNIGHFVDPVHEEITSRIWGCETVDCDNLDRSDAPAAVVAGVRWNDDPRFPLTAAQAKGTKCNIGESIRVATQPICWAQLFKRAEHGAAAGKAYGPGDPLLFRTHFGDLQFLHAMAAHPGESASETQRKMMDWAQFSWRVSSGEFNLETPLRDIPIPTIHERFGMTGWRVLDLLTLGNSGIRPHLREVSFGTLLHMLQDSYAAGHVEREESSGLRTCRSGDYQATAPGTIVEFHAYNSQDHKAHARADSREALLKQIEQEGDLVEVGRTLRKYYDSRASWEVVEPYLQCVFAVRDPSRPASSGDAFSLAGP
ncbi:hypothetical protein [Arenimonas sp.]|uniref:hypothetical protein n=1 Tax=Arenimonas sp. TaxID=1872635 RepID=UPI0039E51DBA